MLAVTILGNNSAIPAFGRNPTAQILQTQDDSFLIDCGEGTQLQIAKYKLRRSKLSHIFISHLHGDHYFGLIGLLTSMSLIGRTQELHLVAPSPLKEIIELQLQVAAVTLGYPLHFHDLGEEGLVAETKKMQVFSFSVHHRIDCWGFLFREKKKPRSIDPEKVKFHEVPAAFYDQLQKGEDYTNKNGVTISNSELTHAAPKPKSYAYCADTLFHESIAEKVKDVDLLYHETTYLKDLAAKAAERFHSTTVQAAMIAKLSGARQLIIGHFSSKYDVLDQFLEEARTVFPNTELALEGACYPIT